jgi:F-type H+-transporting ATPase subunit b
MLILAEMPLGLNPLEVLLHLLNFAILLIAIRFLLYKPIKEFIAKRENEFKSREDESKRLKAEAEELKTKYEKMISDAEKNIAETALKAAEKTKSTSTEILSKARVEADEIMLRAKAEADNELNKALPNIKSASGELAIMIASKVLSREISVEDMDKLIDDCIFKWKNA